MDQDRNRLQHVRFDLASLELARGGGDSAPPGGDWGRKPRGVDPFPRPQRFSRVWVVGARAIARTVPPTAGIDRHVHVSEAVPGSSTRGSGTGRGPPGQAMSVSRRTGSFSKRERWSKGLTACRHLRRRSDVPSARQSQASPRGLSAGLEKTSGCGDATPTHRLARKL